MDGGTEEVRCGVEWWDELHNGAARRRFGLDAHGARTMLESLDKGLGHVARHDEIGGLDLGGGSCGSPYPHSWEMLARGEHAW